MARHPMCPEDLRLFRWAADPDVSADAAYVAWCEISLDLEKDEPVSNIMVADADGRSEPRRFTDGPHDFSPRWAPNARYLAYLSASSGSPAVRIAPLAGGEPIEVESPGTVSWLAWSPQGDRLALVVRAGTRKDDTDNAKERNAPRVIRGTFNRMDGSGWMEGRNHLFVYDVERRTLRQISSGDFDHEQPSWSPGGSRIVFVSDRSRGRDDYIPVMGDIWEMSATGGRSRRLVTGVGAPTAPIYSPDGSRIAFGGVLGRDQLARRDERVFVAAADGSSEPEQLVPGLDNPVGFSIVGRPFSWLSEDELVFTVADRGTIAIRRARVGERVGRSIVEGDTQVSSISIARSSGSKLVAYACAWVDSTSEVACVNVSRRATQTVQLSRAGRELSRTVELRPAERLKAIAPDGTALDYFVIRPKKGRKNARTLPPLFLEIHGGPELYNPIAEQFVNYQVLAGAGYLVALPNPRGSIGYGESFRQQLHGDWGRADFEDFLACADDAIARGLADGDRQFVGGYSYGGFTSAWMVGQTTRFKAAIVGAPVVNLLSQFGTWDGGTFFADQMGTDPWSSRETFLLRSPISFVDKVRTPVFLHVNEGDLRCPPSQADEFYTALKWFGKDVEYVRYPGGSHLSYLPMLGAPSQNEDRQRRQLDFLFRHGGNPAHILPATAP